MPTRSLVEKNHVGTQCELAIRFALWAASLRGVPDQERIRLRFGTSRATAYRWRKAWCDVHGLSTKPAAKPAPEPRNRVLKRAVQHGRAVFATRRCSGCSFFRPGTRGWGDCKRNDFPTMPGDSCLVFKKA